MQVDRLAQGRFDWSTGTEAGRRTLRQRLLRLTDFREFMLLLVIFMVAAVLSLVSETFLTYANLSATLLGLSVESIVAIGMTILLVSGGFDLSVGAAVALSGTTTAMALVAGLPVPVAILCGLSVGMLIGCVNGFFVAWIGINPFITTLGMMSLLRGTLMVVTDGASVAGLPKSFTVIGQGYVMGVQCPILICLILVISFDLLLRYSRFLRQSYYIGGNEKAAILCGIPVPWVKLFNYALTGTLAAVAGIVLTARMGGASVTAGTGLELRVITAVVIGGASLSGGEGTILGAFLGSLLMALVLNALTLLGVNPNWNNVVVGATLLCAVLLDVFSKRLKAGK
ncbi:ABC transporter permease [bacterium]|nr:ABC transporter permease [bacterium]